MFSELAHLWTLATLAVALVALGYVAFALWAVLRRPRRGASSPAFHPPVTILKPVCGLDPGLYENLRSFCIQDYPSYQVVFGVRDRADPAIPVVERVIRDFPHRDLQLVVDDTVVGTNLKISNLANMLRMAKHEILVIADSDMRVGADYLKAVVAPFFDAEVGAVTCLYRGTAAPGVASQLGAMFINDWFLPSALVAMAFDEPRFCFGATMAVRRKVLEGIGGLRALASELADDYMLGKLVSDRGFRVRLAPYVVENVVLESSLQQLYLHALRWARTVRLVRPLGYGFSFITYTTPMALLFALASGFSAAALAVLAGALALRLLLHYGVRRRFGTRGGTRPWLVPVGDVLGFVVWCASFMGQSVRWRNEKFSVDSDGQLVGQGKLNS